MFYLILRIYQFHRCIFIEIVHWYYVIFAFVMIFPSSTRVETKESSVAFKFHALTLWYSCLSRDFMSECMLHVCFPHFECNCVCCVHTIYCKGTSFVCGCNHLHTKSWNHDFVYSPYVIVHELRLIMVKLLNINSDTDTHGLVVVHMLYCSLIAVVSYKDRFCTHYFFI